MHPDGSRQGLDALREYIEEHVSGKSLGPLIGQFNEAILSNDKDLIALELKELVDARNTLVHYFYRNKHFDLLRPGGAQAAIAYLDEQYELFQGWSELFRKASLAVLAALRASNPKIAAEFGQCLDRLVALLPESLRNLVAAVNETQRSQP
jgi:hypothetical protein